MLAEWEFFEDGAGLFDGGAVHDEDYAVAVVAEVPLVDFAREIEAEGGGDFVLEDWGDGGAGVTGGEVSHGEDAGCGDGGDLGDGEGGCG